METKEYYNIIKKLTQTRTQKNFKKLSKFVKK